MLLDIRHSSAEELAEFVGEKLRAGLPMLGSRGVTVIEVGVAEAPNQEARFRIEL